ncbi:MAG: hypothetical protein H6883_06845 [Rhodobiaceae bacterium]|nr:hypothetical protein [Rhodobiaceae bacterium]MCC0055837.1 hypothetical protein [Rhodobiaceae bacterium]
MNGLLWEENSVWIFVLVTVVLGGGAAMLTGRAIARSWRSFPVVAIYLVPLAAAIRFFHFALFGGTLLSFHYFVVDYLVILVLAGIGYRIVRATQMARQYGWLFARSGPFGWRDRTGEKTPT